MFNHSYPVTFIAAITLVLLPPYFHFTEQHLVLPESTELSDLQPLRYTIFSARKGGGGVERVQNKMHGHITVTDCIYTVPFHNELFLGSWVTDSIFGT